MFGAGIGRVRPCPENPRGSRASFHCRDRSARGLRFYDGSEAARVSRDLGLWSGGDRLVRVFGHHVLRVGHRDTRGFVKLPLPGVARRNRILTLAKILDLD